VYSQIIGKVKTLLHSQGGFSKCATFLLAISILSAFANAEPQPSKPPAAKGTSPTDSNRLAILDSVIEQAISAGQIPGAVAIVGHNNAIVYRKAFGSRSLEPRREPMTVGTIFDIASLTKVVATTTAVMQLFEQGKIRLNDPVARYIPEFAQNGKEDITVRQLLTHYSGLAPDLDLKTAWEGKATAYDMAFAAAPQQPPGSGL
jgi:CubicO group peptidase (beta-lactamase class C family)